jgi:flagellar biosynthesis/type III secretory pathway protein FliH
MPDLDAVRAEAEAIRLKAIQDAERIREQARREGYQRGYDEGYHDGEQRGASARRRRTPANPRNPAHPTPASD